MGSRGHSVTKIKCIEVAIETVHKLRLEVGSYALMWGTGFELVDMLLCCKFAEGDSRILQQKLARDRLLALKKGGIGSAISQALSGDINEARGVIKLARALQPAGRDREKLAAAMDANWKLIYDLADKIADRHVRDGRKSKFVEPIVERLQPAATTFDADWKRNVCL